MIELVDDSPVAPRRNPGWFAKGKSPNPGGLPVGTPKISVRMMNILRMTPEERRNFVPKDGGDEAALRCINDALEGDQRAMDRLLERTEGKVTQGLNITASSLSTTELTERLVEAFVESGIDEISARRVLLRLGGGDD